MKPFDLEKALAGEPVVTRDGREVTQLHLFDVDENAEPYPLTGVMGGVTESWTKRGTISAYSNDSLADLFMKSKTVVKWVNIYNAESNFREKAFIYDDERTANRYGAETRIGNKAHRIEWEE